MAFDWTEYLELAKNLSGAPGEASARSAVSRSYYCAYNLALLKAKLNGYRIPNDGTGGSHELLWGLYARNEDDHRCKRLCLLGPRMKRRRVKADYDNFVPKIDEVVIDALQDAEECVALIAALPPDRPKDIARKWSR